jgi:glyoxylase-like metal-dependent hydrolase (beta-lactamase superfamily II)
MPKYICQACGVQYAESASPPSHCIICEDPRQFVPEAGQRWTTLNALLSAHTNKFQDVTDHVAAIWTTPSLAIGQRAFLVQAPTGNVLWDCITLLDEATHAVIAARGGLKAIALSHPHYYGTMASWAEAFDCPVLVHEADRDWIVEPSPRIELWSGEQTEPLAGLMLHRLGGHFPGSTVLHWRDRRILLPGDTFLVTRDRRHVSFMWSYPNYVPLPAADVQRIADRLVDLDFDSIHSAFWERGDMRTGGKEAIARSVARHINGPQL